MCIDFVHSILTAMRLKKQIFNKKNLWILLGLTALTVRGILPPAAVERYYSRGFYALVRHVFDALTSWMPFALVYLLFAILVFMGVQKTIWFFKNKNPWPAKILLGLHGLLAFAGGVVFFFLALWGYNYGRQPLEKSLGISPQPLTVAELRQELEVSTATAQQLRQALRVTGDSAVTATLLPQDLENLLRSELKKCLQQYGYPVSGKVRGRLLYPKGMLLRISTAGVYIPFTGEGHIDPGLHHLQLPFVMVHEMSHGYGFGGEGTCNFLAYLTCRQSENAFLQYVGELYYWRYVASNYRRIQRKEFEVFKENLPPGMVNDLRAIRRQIEKYPDIFPAVRDAAYTAYLHAQGIKDGLKNYNRVIMMVHAWRENGELRIENRGSL
jgi:uncharacterized protein DUF3810